MGSDAGLIGCLLGHYRLEEELGAGGMGTVYRATVEAPEGETTSDEPVAIKVFHRHLLSRPGFFKRFLREADIGRRVDDEHVVRTVEADAAEVDGRMIHFLVTEYVEGQTLRSLLRELGPLPESLLRELGRQIASGLSAIHAAGIVHRDLKPDNVMITRDQQVRIMDLGLARLVDASIELTREGHFAGSVLYAAPEQFGRGSTSSPVDLYTLGVLLYELATGGNPFRRDTPAAAIGAHLDLVPASLLECDVDATPFLAEVVRTLLAKKPEDRFASAEELRAILDAGESSSWWAERETRVLATWGGRPNLGVRRATDVYGRTAEFDGLRTAFARACAGHGNTVLLMGETGIGKTRLVDAFLREAAEEDVAVLYGSYPPEGGAGALSDAVRDHFGAAELEGSLRPYLQSMPALVVPFAAVLRREATSEDAPTLRGDALNAALVQLVRGLAREKPVVWIVDDLHFSEPTSRGAVLAMARGIEEHSVLLLITSRPDLSDEDVSHLTRLESCRRVDLGRLSPREVVELLRDALQSDALADRLGARIAYKSDGIPFFIFEIVKGLEESGLLEKHADGSYVETTVIEQIEVPSAVRDLVEARLEGMGVETRAILDVGAVAGFEFDPDLVCHVLDMRRLPVLQSLAAVARGPGVVRPAGALCRFDHHHIRQVLYEAVPQGLREEYHALLAEAFAKDAKDIDDEGAVFLATHHIEGSRPQEALPFLERALDRLSATHRSDGLLRLAGRALEIEDLLQPRDRVEVLLSMAEQLDRLGRRQLLESALDEAMRAMEGVDDPSLRTRILLQQAGLLRVQGRLDEARAVLDELLETAKRSEDRSLESRAASSLANTLMAQGFYAEALPWVERRLELLSQQEDTIAQAQALGSLAAVRYSLGAADASIELFEQALAMAERHEDPYIQIHLSGNLAFVHLSLGRKAAAEELLERSRTLARQFGDREGEAFADSNLGHLFEGRGLVTEARTHYERALSLHREVGNVSGIASSTGNLGNVAYALGRWEEALAHYARALTVIRSMGDVYLEGLAEVARGQVLCLLGDPDLGREALDRAVAIGRDTGPPSSLAYALFSVGTMDKFAGRFDDALAVTDEALELLRANERSDFYPQVLLQRGQLLVERDRKEEALVEFEEAGLVARELEVPRDTVEASLRRALMGAEEKEVAMAVFREQAPRLQSLQTMRARTLLWRLTGDRAHLEAAHGILGYLIAHAPETYRDSMIERVPLHREIAQAWADAP